MTRIKTLAAYPRRLAHRRLAGRRAMTHYVELRRVWRRNRRKQFALVGLALAALAAAGSGYDLLAFGRVGFVAGVCCGASIAVWFALRDSPPGFVDHWQQGAWREQFIADELVQLPHPAWEPVHDLRDGRGNVDPVVLGPAGVFLLDTKRWAGTISIEGDDLVIVNELDPANAYRDRGRLATARGQAARLNAELRTRSGQSPWVEPVIVIWCTFPARVHAGRGVTVVHGRELVGWL